MNIVKCPDCESEIAVEDKENYDVDCDCGCTIRAIKEVRNRYNLPPDLFDLVCEKSKNPEDPVEVYQVLCQETEIQIAQAYDYPEEDGRFPMIMQCALILEYLRKDAAVQKGKICKECFEPLIDFDDGTFSCENPKCGLYFIEQRRR
jgi:hypothetical protein